MQVTLTKQGTIIEHTENSRLREEYVTRIKPFANNKELLKNSTQKDVDDFKELISNRDHFIAERIDKTLKFGETGFLFLGGIHHVEKFLEPSIKLWVLLGSLRPRNK